MKLQVALFEKIKQVVPNKKELASTLKDLLGVTSDSVYRRMRGETALSLDEAFILAHYFKVSLSDLEGFRNDHVTFVRQPLLTSIAAYKKFMIGSIDHLELMSSDRKNEMWVLAKDIPAFYLYGFKGLAAFKIYTWLRSINFFEGISRDHFDVSNLPEELLILAEKEWLLYNQVNATEIWNESTIFSLLNQIEYYYDSGLLKPKEVALSLCDEAAELLKHVYKQTSLGRRLDAEKKDSPTKVQFKLYFNQSLVLENGIISKLQNRLVYSLPYTSANYLTTLNQEMAEEMERHFRETADASTLVNAYSEKAQNQLFQRFDDRLNQLRSHVENGKPFLV